MKITISLDLNLPTVIDKINKQVDKGGCVVLDSTEALIILAALRRLMEVIDRDNVEGKNHDRKKVTLMNLFEIFRGGRRVTLHEEEERGRQMLGGQIVAARTYAWPCATEEQKALAAALHRLRDFRPLASVRATWDHGYH